MTIGNALALADRLIPNQVDGPVKLLWLSELDRQADTELHRTHKGPWPPFGGYPGDVSMNRELLIPPPYDGVYLWYLELRLWDAAGELRRYNNAVQKFNAAWQSYKDYVNRTYPPLGVRGLRLM